MQRLELQKRLEIAGWLAHVVGLAVAAGIFTLAFLLLLRPIDREHAVIENELEAINQLIDRREEIQQEHTGVQKSVADTQQVLEDLLVRIPDSPRDAEFLAEISRLAQHEGMEIVSFEPFPPSNKAKHHEMQIRLTTRASYPSICHVLDELGQSDRLCRVDRMNIESDAQTRTYTINFSITIFFAPQTGMAVVQR